MLKQRCNYYKRFIQTTQQFVNKMLFAISQFRFLSKFLCLVSSVACKFININIGVYQIATYVMHIMHIHFNSLWPTDAKSRRHQAITWINVILLPVRSSDIHLRAISRAVPQPLITKIGLEMTPLNFNVTLPGANELITTVPKLYHEW